MVKRLTRSQEDIVCTLLARARSETVAQFILNKIGRKNWTRDVLSSAVCYLTGEQEDLAEALGGAGYSLEEVEESILTAWINGEIADQLRKMGVTRYLYQNEAYLDAIRTGEIAVEGIDLACAAKEAAEFMDMDWYGRTDDEADEKQE